MLTYGKSNFIKKVFVRSLGKIGKSYKKDDIELVLIHIRGVITCNKRVLEDKEYLQSIKALYYTKTRQEDMINIFYISDIFKEVYIDMYKHSEKDLWENIYETILEVVK